MIINAKIHQLFLKRTINHMLYDTTEKKIRGLITHFPVSKISKELEEAKQQAVRDRDTEINKVRADASTERETLAKKLSDQEKSYSTLSTEKNALQSRNETLENTNKSLTEAFQHEMAALTASFERKAETLKRVHESEVQQLIDNWPGDEKPILL